MSYRIAAEREMEHKKSLLERIFAWFVKNIDELAIILIVAVVVVLPMTIAFISINKEREVARQNAIQFDKDQNVLVSESRLWAGQWLEHHKITGGVFQARPHNCGQRHCAGYVDVIGAQLDGKQLEHFVISCQYGIRDCFIVKD